MSNAAIFFHPDGFDTSGNRMMGRQSAGESFLRGFIRHAEADRLYFYNWSTELSAKGEGLVRRIENTSKPMTWIGRGELSRIAEPGCMFISSPANAQESWNRRLVGPTRYSVCGLTHTTATQGVMDALIGMLHSPVEPWDALICTSTAVRASTQTQLDLAFDFLAERLGAAKRPPIRLETIPLGINCSDFTRSDAHRAHWRERLGVPEDGIVVLFVGRFSAHAKMNPAPMAIALERAARRTKKPIHWVLSGWAGNRHIHDAFVTAGPRHAPSVRTHVLDGRLSEVRFPIWSAADIFYSLSDNIQETYGLTPVEAMAAGLPSVISDWDGYKDTVRHGIDGFRIPTLAPRAGLATDLAVRFGNGWESYDHYIGASSQFVSVDIEATADALVSLIENDDLRARMGTTARERARQNFDWAAVIPQYQALWTELAAIRKAAPPKPAGGPSPWRPDPFVLYGSYPTEALQPTQQVAATPGATAAAAQALLSDPTVSPFVASLPTVQEAALLMMLAEKGPLPTSSIVAAFPPARRGVAERGLLWLAKFGLVSISPRPAVEQN